VEMAICVDVYECVFCQQDSQLNALIEFVIFR